MLLGLVGCSQNSLPASAPPASSIAGAKPKKTYRDLIIGFAQIGAESEWRVANTKSIKETANNLGVELKFSDAQQNQQKQIEAVRKLIIQKVDVIGISPIVETGWEEVFREAKAAGIPIILSDRRAAVPEDLYVTYLGSDFLEEGRNAARVLAKLVNGEAKIVELQGTIDSAPANDRFTGFREVLKNYPGMKIIDSKSGDFTRARGKEVMDTFMKEVRQEPSLRSMLTMTIWRWAPSRRSKNYGLKPGVDIKIVSVDASHGAFEAMIAGELNATVECNPLLGPQFFDLALKVVNGEAVPKWIPSTESIFYPDNAREILPSRKY